MIWRQVVCRTFSEIKIDTFEFFWNFANPSSKCHPPSIAIYIFNPPRRLANIEKPRQRKMTAETYHVPRVWPPHYNTEAGGGKWWVECTKQHSAQSMDGRLVSVDRLMNASDLQIKDWNQANRFWVLAVSHFESCLRMMHEEAILIETAA